MKYATLTGLALLLNIWVVAANAWSTGEKTDFTLTKQQLIYQLNDQLNCIKTASDHDDLSACKPLNAQTALPSPAKPSPSMASVRKTEDPALVGFF